MPRAGRLLVMTDEKTAGCVITTDEHKRYFASKSLKYCLKEEKFNELFQSKFDVLGIDKEKLNKFKSVKSI